MEIYPDFTLGSLVLTDYPYSVEFGGDFGAPESVTEVAESMLADGDIVTSRRDGNRGLTLTVLVEGADFLEIAENEAALRRECAKARNELRVDPGDGFGVPTVFETFRASMVWQRDDTHEQHMLRRWEISIPAGPYGRSADLTVVPALSVGVTPSITVFDTCDVATGWTGQVDGVAAAASTVYEAGTVGVVVFDYNTDLDADTIKMQRTGVVDFTTTPYLIVEARTVGPSSNLIVRADGVALTLIDIRDIGGDHLEYTYLVEDTSVSVLEFEHTRPAGDTYWLGLVIYDLTKSNMPPNLTQRQVTRIIWTGGTERTPASLQLTPQSGESAGLAIVHTSPEDGTGYFPAMRRWRTSGNTETTDAATMSGKREVVNTTPNVSQIPISSVPEGGYALLGLMRSSVVGSFEIDWHARTFLDGGYLGGPTGSAMATFPTANEWTLIPLGVVTLPPVRSASGFVQINLSRIPVAAEVIDLDEWWHFRTSDDCALTITVGGGFIWLDSPDTSSPVPRVSIGQNGDRSDAHHPGTGLFAQGSHVLHPDGTSVFVAASGLAYPRIQASYYKRWHSNAAE